VIRCAVTVRRPAFTLAVELALGAPATGIFGPSGAGKSTLLHALAGLVPAERCELAVDDAVIDGGGRRTPVHRRGVAVVFQDHRLFPHLTIADNLRYGLRPGPVGFNAVVELLDLGPRLGQRPAACSGGERQRAALGRALLSQPRLLLLDEPLASLDRGLKRQILPYLRRLRRLCPAPLIHVSHDLDELLAVTDELVLVEAGGVVAQGPVDDLALRPEVLARLHDFGLVNTIPATVDAHAMEDGLSWLRPAAAPGLRLAAARCPQAPGAAVDLLLRPRDLVLADGPVSGLSMGGALDGRIDAVVAAGDRVMVRVAADGLRLLVEVSPQAVRRLALAPGRTVSVLWKTQAAVVRER
jgi:molybdate transport system ATP-binding protein